MTWKIRETGTGDNLLYSQAGTPSLDLRFATEKSLDDYVSASNLITFTRASTGTYVDSSGVIQTAAIDEPRFDHDPSTLESLGLLIEESRTNYILNSNFPVPYSSGSVITEVSGITTPDGNVSTVKRHTRGNGQAAERFGDLGSGLAGTVYAGSIYVRTVSGTETVEIDVNDSPAVSYTITENWTRVYASGSITPNNFRFFDLVLQNNDVYIWGAQIEEGAFPTSYIPTSGSTVTRAADSVSITGANFSSFYNQSEGTMFVEDKANPLDFYPMAWVLQNTTNTIDGTVSNFLSPAGDWTLDSRNCGGDFDLTYPNVPGSFVKRAAKLKNDDIALVLNGSIQTLLIPGNITASTSYLYIGQRPPNFFYNGHIKRLAYWPTRLSDATLQSITAP